jgi:predicted alpha-1,6-mannanase (GH76 family)
VLTVVTKGLKLFFHSHKPEFLNHGKAGGAYDGAGHLTIWPVAVFVQSVIDSARVFPDTKNTVVPACRAFYPYYSPDYRMYCASVNFSGNRDIYYDDNAQVASCFITGYEVTGDRELLGRAVELVNSLMGGQDRGRYGGVRWHMEKQGSNTCTTAEVGVACARLARLVQNNQNYVQFAQMCHQWIFERVQDKGDKLICDGLEPDGDHFKLNDAKWTYNQGTPLTLSALLYNITGNKAYYESAKELVLAVTDHNTAIFDRDTPRMETRQYRDSTAFYQLLAEGFADYLLFFGQFEDPKVAERIVNQVKDTLHYVWKYMRDPHDGLYFNTFSIWKIDQRRRDAFQELTGENKTFEPDSGEREQGDGPVEKRPFAKTLMGCGAAARVFFQSARLVPTPGFNDPLQ